MEIVRRNQTGEGFRLRLEAKLKNAALVQARENLGLKQNEAAKRIGVHITAYNGYETMRHYPSETMKKKICAFYTQNGQSLDERVVFPVEIAKTKFARKYVAERTIAPENLVALSELRESMLPPSEENLDKLMDDDEKRYRFEQIKQVLSKLSKYQQAVIRLSYGFDGEPKSIEEIAVELNREPRSVQNSIVNATIRLKKFVRFAVAEEKARLD